MLTTTFLAMGILLACMAAAAWPLLAIPRVRAILACAGGSCCVGVGAMAMGLATSGFVAVPGFEPSVRAAEEADEEVVVEVETPNPAGEAKTAEVEAASTQPEGAEEPAATSEPAPELAPAPAPESTVTESAAPAIEATESVSLPAPASDPVIDE